MEEHDDDEGVESLHVVPVQDTKKHIASSSCWCEPDMDAAEDTLVYIHRPLDGRDRRLH